MITYYTYFYIDPLTEDPFYIGKGSGDRSLNLNADRNPHVRNKIKSLIKQGLTPGIVISPCISEQAAYENEEYAIQIWGRKDQGKGPLLNMTDGGEGQQAGEGHPAKRPEVRQRISEATSEGMLQPEVRTRNSKLKIGNKNSVGNRSTTGMRGITNGTVRTFIAADATLPEGFRYGWER